MGRDVSIGANVVVGEHCEIGDACTLGPGTVLEAECRLGAGCRLFANVSLGHGVYLGQRVIIHPGAVIGADGFGIAFAGDHWEKVPQLGSVTIGDDCEIGANTCIDRGAIEDTVLGNDVRIDNLVQIAHNVRIGSHTAIAANCGLAGSTTVGEYCLLAGGVGVGGLRHLEIAERSTILAGSDVTVAGLDFGKTEDDVTISYNLSEDFWKTEPTKLLEGDDLGAARVVVAGTGFVGDGSGTVRALDAKSGIPRIRFTTSHPKDFSEELVECVGSLASVCEAVHLPLQAGGGCPLPQRRQDNLTAANAD